ncbi:SRPBCC family protein [Sphingobacterium deserti]|uniref:Activator of HSP90 ATPase 1 family protein n=1 Tax=Sphingobacterium deserti TaxID=1229276 RepID=A0A0B8SZQ4_9SPHI|nr:SRPBCC domain-containing protein [Sphingobacterium deserti]KGE13422.1 activator of HSP90 ATPase 1 family protein [Sphingobacterium deserti]
MERTNTMQFEIAADGRSVHISRQYAAPLEQVWKAWTEASILDQWWAPEPWKCHTKHMDFREGGEWLYSMNGPDGEVAWSRCSYGEIELLSYFEGKDNFCDEHGQPNADMPSMHWRTEFSENEMGTRVENHLRAKSAEDLSQLVDMGFREGFEMGQNNLGDWLANNK